ncbi:hypothetical protein JOD67_001200 [Tenggerimyces flavus]|nr:polyprenol phosphomannose-dependent alpha 1,6 mannosyltransferase MptB [Tenggerimyces flavus]MBM7784520.1 hypothetical protein [Tenggerimyces flavus]
MNEQGRRAIVLVATSFALVFLVGFLGPSIAVVTLPQRQSWHPPFWIDAHPHPAIIISLIVAAIACGGIGIYQGLRALAAGWQPRHLAKLGIAGIVAVTLVPPMGSGDILMYAAYGRIAALGSSPYVLSPADLSRLINDPIANATEAPWQEKTSVYGPIATWLQQGSSFLGGDSTHATVMWLQLVNALAYVGVGLLTIVLAGQDPKDRARATLFILANPVLVLAVVGGAHNDAQAVVFAIAALVVARRMPFAAGLLLGLGGAVKLNVGLFGLALLWGLRKSKRRMAELCAGAALALVGTYVTAGPEAFHQITAAVGYVSTGTPWRWIFSLLHLTILPIPLARTVVALLAITSIVLVSILLHRALPAAIKPPAGPDDPTPDAVRAAAVLGLAWVLLTHYTLPWYDIVAWAPLAAVAATQLDKLLLLRTSVLAAAYTGSRAIVLPAWLQFIQSRLLDTISPLVQLTVIVLLIRWCRRRSAAPKEPVHERQ